MENPPQTLTDPKEGKKLRLTTLRKAEGDIYVLRQRPIRVYVKRGIDMFRKG